MLKQFIFLFFLYGFQLANGRPQNDVAEAREGIANERIKKNYFGANGTDLRGRNENILKNFRNPVLEYLLNGNQLRTENPVRKGIIREIQHRQTLLIPNLVNENILRSAIFNTGGDFQAIKTSEVKRDPNKSSLENFLNYVNNQKEENLVSSQVLNLNKEKPKNNFMKVEVYPAVAVLVNTFGEDGVLKNTVTHFEPNFDLIRKEGDEKPEINEPTIQNKTINMEKNLNQVQKMHYSEHINKLSGNSESKWSVENEEKSHIYVDGATHEQVNSLQTRQSGLTWPFANYFPIVINDPFLTAYNAFTSSMYNTFSSMVEYGPEADICRSKTHSHDEQEKTTKSENVNNEKLPKVVQGTTVKSISKEVEAAPTEDIFDEIQIESLRLEKPAEEKANGKVELRRRTARDLMGISMETKRGDVVKIKVGERKSSNGVFLPSDDIEERSRSHSVMLVNPPPLSSILRPPYTGFSDKKKKPSKPSKPDKEENEETSEEVGEEEETSSQEGTSDGVAISPPPEGASIAEAKPVGLAIAGPGGVAAAKPQGTAVAGPGGLAIARPVGTAIAGVDVEGSIPIGAQQQKNKNKKRPKQEPDSEGDLQYVGGLTGPIGNPQPKQFDDTYFGGLKGTIGNPKSRFQDDTMYFRARHHNGGYQMKLGQFDGKYGFLPVYRTPERVPDRLQKRMDNPTYFHGLLGTNKNVPENDQQSFYPIMYY